MITNEQIIRGFNWGIKAIENEIYDLNLYWGYMTNVCKVTDEELEAEKQMWFDCIEMLKRMIG